MIDDGDPSLQEPELTEEEKEAERQRELELMEQERQNDPLFQAPHLQEGIPPVTCNFGKADYWDGRYHKVRKCKQPPPHATPSNLPNLLLPSCLISSAVVHPLHSNPPLEH